MDQAKHSINLEQSPGLSRAGTRSTGTGTKMPRPGVCSPCRTSPLPGLANGLLSRDSVTVPTWANYCASLELLYPSGRELVPGKAPGGEAAGVTMSARKSPHSIRKEGDPKRRRWSGSQLSSSKDRSWFLPCTVKWSDGSMSHLEDRVWFRLLFTLKHHASLVESAPEKHHPNKRAEFTIGKR